MCQTQSGREFLLQWSRLALAPKVACCDQVIVDSKMYARRRLLELREKTIIAAEAFVKVRPEPGVRSHAAAALSRWP